jgi:2-oxoisovalerate dehydrogenase E1 component beta subunit
MLQVEAIRSALARGLGERRDALLIGSDVAGHGGPFRATSGLAELIGAERLLDMPRNPSTVFGIARGLALAGRPVVCELAPDDAERAIGALAHDAARWVEQQGTMVDASWGVPQGAPKRAAGQVGAIVVRIPVARGTDLEGVLGVHARGARVFVPSRPIDAWQAICAGLAADGQVVFVLEPEELYRGHDAATALPEVERIADVAWPSAWREVRAGDDAVVVTWGAGVPVAAQASALLQREGYGVAVIDAVRIDGLPDGTFEPKQLQAVGERAGRVLVATATGHSAGDGLARRIAEAAFLSLEAPVRAIVAPADPAKLVAELRQTLDY